VAGLERKDVANDSGKTCSPAIEKRIEEGMKRKGRTGELTYLTRMKRRFCEGEKGSRGKKQKSFSYGGRGRGRDLERGEMMEDGREGGGDF